MKPQLHDFAEQVCDCVIAMKAYREASREAMSQPSPESRHFERVCHEILDKFPDHIQTEAAICISRRAA